MSDFLNVHSYRELDAPVVPTTAMLETECRKLLAQRDDARLEADRLRREVDRLAHERDRLVAASRESTADWQAIADGYERLYRSSEALRHAAESA